MKKMKLAVAGCWLLVAGCLLVVSGCGTLPKFQKEKGALGLAESSGKISSSQADAIRKIAAWAFGAEENPVKGIEPETSYTYNGEPIDPALLKRTTIWKRVETGPGAVAFSGVDDKGNPVAIPVDSDEFSRENIRAMLRASGITKPEDVK